MDTQLEQDEVLTKQLQNRVSMYKLRERTIKDIKAELALASLA